MEDVKKKNDVVVIGILFYFKFKISKVQNISLILVSYCP